MLIYSGGVYPWRYSMWKVVIVFLYRPGEFKGDNVIGYLCFIVADYKETNINKTSQSHKDYIPVKCVADLYLVPNIYSSTQ